MGRLSGILWVALCHHKGSYKGKGAGGSESEKEV